MSYPAAIFSPSSWEGDRLKPFTVARWPWRDAPFSSGQGKPYIRENANVSKTVESLSWPLKNQSRTTHRTLSYCYCCWFFFSFRFSFFLKNNSNDKNNDKNIFLMSHCEIKFSNHSSIQRGPEELKVKTSKQLKVREDVHDKVWRLASASDWWRGWREILLNQSHSEAKRGQYNTGILSILEWK